MLLIRLILLLIQFKFGFYSLLLLILLFNAFIVQRANFVEN